MRKNANIVELNGHSVLLLESHITNEEYQTDKQQCFIIGSKGIPASYGGFETFVEKLTKHRLSNRIRYHVARIGDKDFRYEYNNAKCFSVAVPNIGSAKAIYYDIKALRRCINYCKARPAIQKPVFYILACRIGPLIRHYKKKIQKLGGLLYVNPDGHEWMRPKWNFAIRKYWKWSERLMVKHADLLVCDSQNIEKYICHTYKEYKPKTVFIAYGAELTPSPLSDEDPKLTKWYKKNNLKKGEYYLMVCRFVPENSFDTIFQEFMASKSKHDLAVITTADDKYMEKLEKRLHFKKDPRIKFVGTVYNQDLLKKIRENAYAYIHGHTVGGTNPSLLEALSSTQLNLLVDVGFNREVAEDGAVYWTREPGSLARLIEQADEMDTQSISELGKIAKKRVEDKYTWRKICHKYEQLFLEGNKQHTVKRQ